MMTLFNEQRNYCNSCILGLLKQFDVIFYSSIIFRQIQRSYGLYGAVTEGTCANSIGRVTVYRIRMILCYT